jgi:glycine dehydrogenase subunit 2
MSEPTLFEKSSSGRRGVHPPKLDLPQVDWDETLPESMRPASAPVLPEVSELEVVRHFVRLSQLNYGIDTTMYPLGSCTMKYNPRINEVTARLPGFARLHPLQPEETVQGALELMHSLQGYLQEIIGMDAFTLQPAAGAQGELTALFEVVTIPSNPNGDVDLEALKGQINPRLACLMLTNPSTLGLFEVQIQDIARLVHEAGALLYYDGANMNALLGQARPGDMGFDLVHLNLHKSFSTPHGGGGPGAGPVGARGPLVHYLPSPRVRKEGDRFSFYKPEHSIGRVRTFWGNFLVLVRAYTYIRNHGPEGIRAIGEGAVLNANYLLSKVREAFDLPFDRRCMHEFVLSARTMKSQRGVRAMDVAKRLLDYGYYAPTVYFPLIVEEALMIEPTETESMETMDRVADTLIRIAKEDPELIKSAPHTTPVSRLDEVRAARKPILRWEEGLS